MKMFTLNSLLHFKYSLYLYMLCWIMSHVFKSNITCTVTFVIIEDMTKADFIKKNQFISNENVYLEFIITITIITITLY